MSDQKQLLERVESALDSVRPHLKVDGGNVEIVEITADKCVKIKWLGNCESCSMSAMTMRAGISEAIKMYAPEIVSVEAVNGAQV